MLPVSVPIVAPAGFLDEATSENVLAGARAARQQRLDQVAARALDRNQDTRPVSGRQELLENLLNSYM